MNEEKRLARMAGFFHSEMEDYKDEMAQHPDFADHCALAMATILIAGCGIGMSWSFYLFPVATICVSGLIGAALVGCQVIYQWVSR